MKHKLTCIWFTVLILFIGWLALCALTPGIQSLPMSQDHAEVTVLEVRDLQQRLLDLGYPVTVDNIFGPETKHYLNLAVCQQYASEHERTKPCAK